MKEYVYAAVVAAGVAFASCKGDDAQVGREPLAVVTETVEMTTEYAAQEYVGTVAAEQSSLVSFTGTGAVKEMAVREGQTVRKGQLIARLDAEQSENMLAEAELAQEQSRHTEAVSANLREQAANQRRGSDYSEEQARQSLALAEASLRQALDARERMQALHDAGSLPDIKWVEVQTKVDQAQASYEAARKVVDQSKIQTQQNDLGLRQAETTQQSSRVATEQAGVSVDIARKNLKDCAIYAPTDGVVVQTFLNAGEVALPSQPVARIMTTADVDVVVAVPERDIASIGAGTRCVVRCSALAGEEWVTTDVVKLMDGDALTHTYKVKVRLRGAGQKLLPGMVCSVAFCPAGAEPRLMVPVRAVQQRSDGTHFVWVARGSKAHRQTIELGQLTGNRAVVTAGLRRGDKMITEGYQKVDEGGEIIIKK